MMDISLCVGDDAASSLAESCLFDVGQDGAPLWRQKRRGLRSLKNVVVDQFTIHGLQVVPVLPLAVHVVVYLDREVSVIQLFRRFCDSGRHELW